MAKQRLKMNGLEELSLVDNPANQHSRSVIAKRMPSGGTWRDRFAGIWKAMLPKGTAALTKEAETYGQARALSELWEKTSALSTAVASIIGDETLTSDAKQAKMDEALSAFRRDVMALDSDGSAFVGKDGGDAAGKTTKADPPLADPDAGGKAGPGDDNQPETQGNRTMKRIVKTYDDLAAANAAIAKLTEEANTADAKVDALEAAADPVGAITKGMSEPAAKAYREQHDRVTTLEKRDRDRSRQDRVVKMAANSGAEIPGLGLVVKAVDGEPLTTEERTSAEAFLTGAFKAYGALADEFEKIGGELGGAGDSVEGDGSELEAAVAKAMAADPKLTRPEAVAKVVRETPSLYDDSEDAVAGAGTAG